MTGRYEIKDSQNPQWKGQRRTSLEAAIKEAGLSFPQGRFYVYDRLMKERVN